MYVSRLEDFVEKALLRLKKYLDHMGFGHGKKGIDRYTRTPFLLRYQCLTMSSPNLKFAGEVLRALICLPFLLAPEGQSLPLRLHLLDLGSKLAILRHILIHSPGFPLFFVFFCPRAVIEIGDSQYSKG